MEAVATSYAHDVVQPKNLVSPESARSANLSRRVDVLSSSLNQLELSPIRQPIESRKVSPMSSSTDSNTSSTATKMNSPESMSEAAQRAAEMLKEGQYEKALGLYETACNMFSRLPAPTLVDACDCASYWRSIGGIHATHLGQHEPGFAAWREAEALYRTNLENLPVRRTESGDDDVLDTICMDRLWMQTLQARAALVYQHDPLSAVECHEEALGRLLALSCEFDSDDEEEEDALWDREQLQAAKEVFDHDGVRFEPLGTHERTNLIVISGESLVTLYRKLGDDDVDLSLIHQTLGVIRQRYDEEIEQSTDPESATKLVNSLARILRELSYIYHDRGDEDQAVDAFHDVMDIRLSSSSLPTLEDIESMEEMGRANESKGAYDKALACYEKAVLARSRCQGEDHIDVAKSLINVARVMELQGNQEGSMDLYRAAQGMYAKQVTSQSFNVEGEDIVKILQLVPAALEQGRYEEAVAYLNKCLVESENSGEQLDLDLSRIYFDLGKAYIGLKDYVPATISLLEAAKEDGDVPGEEALALLHYVESLQRTASSSSYTSDDVSERVNAGIGENRIAPHSASTGRELVARKRRNHNLGSNTPVTWEGLTVGDSKSVDIVARRNDTHFADGEESSEDEGTAFYDSESEAGVARIPRSDVSSSEEPDDVLSLSDERISPPLSIEPITIDDVPDESVSRPESRSSSSPRRRRNNVFRRKRRKGFESLDEGDAVDHPVNNPDHLPPEDDYHSYATFDGPIQYINARTASNESSISQLTVRLEDPSSSRDTSQEWWWGVTPKGLGRWFPSKYVNKAVEAAEGFLSAEAIHSQKRPQQTDFVLSEDEEDEPSADADQQGSLVCTDHASHLGVATSKATKELAVNEIRKPNLGSTPQNESKIESLFSGPQRQNSADLTAEIQACASQLKKQRQDLGSHHPEVGRSLFSLAVLQSRAHKSSEALEAGTEALTIQKRNGSTEECIQSLHLLADLHLQKKNYTPALTFYAEALKLESTQYGEYSDQAATTLNCIGNVRSWQGEYNVSIESHLKALKILNDTHGDNVKHPLIADTLCQLGSVYYRERNSLGAIKSQSSGLGTFIEGDMLEVIGRAHEERGYYKISIGFFEEKLQFLENSDASSVDLGKTTGTLNSLGMLCTKAGLFSEAIDYYERALSIQLQLGCNEVQLASIRILTAAVQYQLGKWEEALALLEDALAVCREELSENHEMVGATFYQIGVVRAALCEHDLAIDSLRKALEIQLASVGSEHPSCLRTRREIGKMYSMYESELDAAFDIFEEVLDTQKTIHGEKHPNVADTLHCIGSAHATKGDYSSALRYLEECYYMRLEFLGWDHPLQATTLHEIAEIHLNRRRLEKAGRICNVVLRIRSESLCEKHADLVRALITKGKCLTAKGDFVGASQCLNDAQEMCNETVGREHPIAGDCHLEIGTLHLRKCLFDEARQEMQKALSIYNAKLDQDHPAVVEAAKKLKRVERDEELCV